MIKPRPEVVANVRNLARRCGCTGAELHAACDLLELGVRRGPPDNKSYGRLLWAMEALVAVYGRNRFTAAKQILNLDGKPLHQRENHARALVRRFDECYKEGQLKAGQEYHTRSYPGTRASAFYRYWQRSGLPWPQDIKSATDMEVELQTLAIISNGLLDTLTGDYVVALDKSIAASTFQKRST